MSPEELANSMAEVMQSPEIQDMLNDPATMLQQMKGSGLMDDAQVRDDVRDEQKNAKRPPHVGSAKTATAALCSNSSLSPFAPAPLPNSIDRRVPRQPEEVREGDEADDL